MQSAEASQSLNPPDKSLESIFKYFSIAYVLLITSGLFYNIFFFKHYGIIITEYIDLSEVLLLFMPMLSNFFMMSFLIMLPILFLAHNVYFRNLDKEDQQLENKKTRVTVILCFQICIFGAFIFYLLSNLFSQLIDAAVSLLIFGTIIFLPLIVDFVFISLKKQNIISLPKSLIDIVFVVIIFLSFVFWGYWSKNRNINLKRHQSYFEIVFKDNAPSIYSNTNLYYLGRTKNYLFIYSYPDKKTSVFNVGDIKKFTVSENEPKK